MYLLGYTPLATLWPWYPKDLGPGYVIEPITPARHPFAVLWGDSPSVPETATPDPAGTCHQHGHTPCVYQPDRARAAQYFGADAAPSCARLESSCRLPACTAGHPRYLDSSGHV